MVTVEVVMAEMKEEGIVEVAMEGVVKGEKKEEGVSV